MSTLIDLAYETLGAILAHPAVGTGLRLGLVYLSIVWLASAWWAFRDAGLRMRWAPAPYVVAASVVLLTPLLFPLAIAVWRVVRPATTLRDARASALQHELLVDDATRETCPSCGLDVTGDWVRCPACRHRLATPCTGCGRNVAPDWTICAWCATDIDRGDALRTPARLVASRAEAVRGGRRPVAVGPGRPAPGGRGVPVAVDPRLRR